MSDTNGLREFTECLILRVMDTEGHGNAPHMISLSGALYTIPQLFSLELDPQMLAFTGTVMGGALLSLILAVLWVKRWVQRAPLDVLSVWCLFGALTPCLSPHALFYDMGIQIVSLALLVAFDRDSNIALWVTLASISWLFMLLKGVSSFPFFFFLSLGLLLWCILQLREYEESTSSDRS